MDLTGRLRAAAETSDHPPTFGLFLEAAEALEQRLGLLRDTERRLQETVDELRTIKTEVIGIVGGKARQSAASLVSDLQDFIQRLRVRTREAEQDANRDIRRANAAEAELAETKARMQDSPFLAGLETNMARGESTATVSLAEPPPRERVEAALRKLGIEPDADLRGACWLAIDLILAGRAHVTSLQAAAQKRQTVIDRQGHELGELRKVAGLGDAALRKLVIEAMQGMVSSGRYAERLDRQNAALRAQLDQQEGPLSLLVGLQVRLKRGGDLAVIELPGFDTGEGTLHLGLRMDDGGSHGCRPSEVEVVGVTASMLADARDLQDLLDEPARRQGARHQKPRPPMPVGTLLRYAFEWVLTLRAQEQVLADLMRVLDLPNDAELRDVPRQDREAVLAWLRARLAGCAAEAERLRAVVARRVDGEVDTALAENARLLRYVEPVDPRAELAAAKADAAMWRRRAERLQAWFALPPDQRHPLGPELSGSLSQSMEAFAAGIAALPRNGLEDAQLVRELIPDWQEVAAKAAAEDTARVEARLHELVDGQRLAVAVRDGFGPLEMLVLDPGQDPPLGTAWTVYGPMTAELRACANRLGEDP